MDRLRPAPSCRLENPFTDEVALCSRPWADQVGVVGRAHMQRIAICLGVNGDGTDAELAQRLEDPNRDLATVRDQHLRERSHRRILPERCRSPIS